MAAKIRTREPPHRWRVAALSAHDDRAAMASARLATAARIPHERSQLRLVYQPRVNLRTLRVEAAEALLRWQHPTRGVVFPDAFISLAEESGDIVSIGAWVLDEAVRQVAAWRRLNASIKVAVNVSPRQIDDGTLFAIVNGALARHRVPAQALELEITESCVVRDPCAAAGTMRDLVALGVGVSIDDFGKGFSGIPTLCWLPATGVKIDKSLVDRLLVEPVRASALLKGVVAFAHSIGAVAVAEGVELDVQVEPLRRVGCDQAQGFLFGRPVPFLSLRSDLAALCRERLDACASLSRMAPQDGSGNL